MNAIDKRSIEDFWVVGINYKKTDASLRGVFAVNTEQYEQLLSVAKDFGIKEFFILSTCNRTEIYGFATKACFLADFLCSACGGDIEIFKNISYSKSGLKAVEHLFHVGAGLDSQILGDYEILGQIKTAVKNAKAHGFIGGFTERLVNAVLQASKAIKTHTALSSGTVSVSFAAIQYIREFFEGPATTPEMKCPATAHIMSPATIDHYIEIKQVNIEDKKIVLLGTGKIGRSTCRNLIDYLNTRNITLINRTKETADVLARELGVRSAPFANLEEELSNADIVLVSTNAPEPVILARHLEHRDAMLVIDLSIPANVEEAAQRLPGISFVNVDTLSKIKDETLQQRKAEVPKAVAIINELIAEFIDWYDMRRHVPVFKQVKSTLKSMQVSLALAGDDASSAEELAAADDERIQKVINSLANNIRLANTPGCHFIQAINEYIG
jgi:glutamyl-tRNA reductase